MTNYITPNANYDLFSTASYATLDTYLKNDPIVKFKTVLDAVSQMFSSEIQECFEKKSSNSNPRNAGRRAYQPEFMFKLCLLLLLLFKSGINLLTRFGKTNPINFDKNLNSISGSLSNKKAA